MYGNTIRGALTQNHSATVVRCGQRAQHSATVVRTSIEIPNHSTTAARAGR